MNNMEPLTAALPAGEWVTLPAHGTKLYPVTLTGVLLVEFMSSDSLRTGSAEMEVGDGGGPGGFFNRVRVKSATAQTVRLIVTSGDFAVSRIAGQVEVAGVIETAPDYSRVLADSVWRCWLEFNANASNYPRVDWMNPATSGKNIVVTATTVNCTAAGLVYAGPIADTEAGVAFSGDYNCLVGGSASVLEIDSWQDTVLPDDAYFASPYISAPFRLSVPAPIIIPPGQGLRFHSKTTGSQIGVELVWFEEVV